LVALERFRSVLGRGAWIEEVCTEANQYVIIGKETYLVSLDGFLMPIAKNQPPPDLKYFKPAPK
jgi:hypothetical protein